MRYFKHIIAFIVLVLVQVLFMNGIYLTIGVLPCLYIYFIFITPISIKPVYLFILSFAMGVVVDIFTDSLGVNALSCVIMSMVVHLLMQNIDRSKMERNNIKYMGSQVFTTTGYIRNMAIITLVHHLLFFILSDWSSAHFLDTLFIVVISSISTIIFMLIFDILFFKNKL